MNNVQKKTWEEFRSSKLLWFVNRTLHLFGWAIIVELDQDGHANNAYPARVTYRGFDEDTEEDGFVGLTKHLAENIEELQKDLAQ